MEVWWIGPDGSVQAAYHEAGWNFTRWPGRGRPHRPAASPGSSRAATRWRCGGSGRTGRSRPPTTTVAGTYYASPAGAAATTGGITAVFKGGDSMEVWWVGPDGSVTGAFHEARLADLHACRARAARPRTCRITSAFGGSLVANVMRVWWVDAAGTTVSGVLRRRMVGVADRHGANPSGATVGVLFNPDTPTASGRSRTARSSTPTRRRSPCRPTCQAAAGCAARSG